MVVQHTMDHGVHDEALTLTVDPLLEVLKQGGLPCTVDGLRERFVGCVRHAMRAHGESNTRLTPDR
jgi:hypothetical protein